MPGDPKIGQELEKFGVKESLAADCTKISDVLSAGPEDGTFKEGLEDLERELKVQSAQSAKRAMGQVLMRSEQSWGCNVVADGSARVTVLRMLTPAEFGQQFTDCQLFKDPGVSANHGEHTHRIQWYIISKTNLVDDPAAVLVGMKDHLSQKDNANGLWDCVFDRLPRWMTFKHFLARDGKDFRCPEHLNLWLKERSESYPVLATYLTQRFEKRGNMPEERIQQFVDWMERHADSDAKARLIDLIKEWDAESVLFAIPYALRKTGKSFANATPGEVNAAMDEFERGKIGRGNY